MSCPDWRHLDPEAGATRWEDALRHLDAGCQSCRRDALAADPTLVFRRLPVATLTPAAEADEVAAARFAVAAMRTASRNTGRASLEARVPSVSRTVRSLRDRHALHGAKRWALAAGLAAMALLFGSEHGFRGETAALEALHLRQPQAPAARQAGAEAAPPASLPAAAAAAAMGAAPGAVGQPASDVVPAAARTTIDGVSRPGARVYQIDGPQMSVVMIVDEKLDV